MGAASSHRPPPATKHAVEPPHCLLVSRRKSEKSARTRTCAVIGSAKETKHPPSTNEVNRRRDTRQTCTLHPPSTIKMIKMIEMIEMGFVKLQSGGDGLHPTLDDQDGLSFILSVSPYFYKWWRRRIAVLY